MYTKQPKTEDKQHRRCATSTTHPEKSVSRSGLGAGLGFLSRQGPIRGLDLKIGEGWATM